jgi:hypothetical protein
LDSGGVSSGSNPTVLVVDDNPLQQRVFVSELLRKAGATARLIDPTEVELDHLAVDLVLVDFVVEAFDLSNPGALYQHPRDGVALAAILQRWAENLQAPPAFSLRSGHLQDLGPGDAAEVRGNVVARALNLEWVFDKEHDQLAQARQVAELAAAHKSLPSEGDWLGEDPLGSSGPASKMLGINRSVRWAELAVADVEGARPPLFRSSSLGFGRSMIRWLLHRVLPYPTFLADSHWLGARLRVELPVLPPDGHAELLEPLLGQARYRGALNGFLGPRWWKSGVESLLWEGTKGRSSDPSEVADLLRRKGLGDLVPLEIEDPVVCLDDRFMPTRELVGFGQTVSIILEDWPAFAEPPRVPINTVIERGLTQAVSAEDLALLDLTGNGLN